MYSTLKNKLKEFFEEITPLEEYLLDRISNFNPKGEGIIDKQEVIINLAEEVRFISKILQGKSFDDINLMFQSMIDIWDLSDISIPTEKYKLAAPVYSISVIAKGYNLPRCKLIEQIAREIALRACIKIT